MYPALVVTFSLALLFAMITCMAVRPDNTKKLIVTFMVTSSLTGILLYAIGYGNTAKGIGEVILAVPRVVAATIFMFVGRDGYSAVMGNWQYFSEHTWLQIIFWFVHMLAIYVAATTVLVVIGQRFVRNLRKISERFSKNVLIIYGVNERAYNFAKDLYDAKESANVKILFIGEATEEFEKEADKIGALVLDESRMEDERWFLKRGFLKNKSVKVLCMNDSDTQTKAFLYRLIETCKKFSPDVSEFQATVICENENNFNCMYEDTALRFPCRLTGKDECPVINVYSRASLAARRLMEMAPVYKQLNFENGRVKDETEADPEEVGIIIVGFGDVGQAVLKSLVRNGCFEGSELKIRVVEKAGANCGGIFRHLYDYMIKMNHIEFVDCDTGSDQFVELVNEMAMGLRYIIACAGDERRNVKIMDDLHTYIRFHDHALKSRLVIAKCDKEEVEVHFFNREGRGRLKELVPRLTEPSIKKVIDAVELTDGRKDYFAKAVNSIYCMDAALKLYPEPEEEGAYDKNREARNAYLEGRWYAADVSDRESSRAMADFAPAYLKVAGGDMSWQELYEKINFQNESQEAIYYREVLSRTEHLRWSGFEYSIGVRLKEETCFRSEISQALEIFEEIEPQFEKKLEELSGKPQRTFSGEEAEECLSWAKELAGKFTVPANRARKNIPAGGYGGEHILLTSWEDLDQRWEEYRKVDGCLKMISYYEEAVRYMLGLSEGKAAPVKPGNELSGEKNFKILDTNNIIGFAKMMAQEEAKTAGEQTH